MQPSPWKNLATLAALAALTLATAGCGMHAPSMSVQAGVTTGGAQDIGLARNQIAAGQIPRPETFVIEGLLSEHDIAIETPPCEQRFCMNTAVGWAPALDTRGDALFMVVGLSSNVDLRTFRRDPLNVSIVVDRSGSMGDGKMAAARQAVHRLIDTLGEGDSFSLVAFDDEVDVLVSQQPVGQDARALHEAVAELNSRGSTDIESALAEGFSQVDFNRHPRQQNRVILITDARPNTGSTETESFLGLAKSYGERGIGLTVFGVGIDFGHDLVMEISRLPGGNYIYIENHTKLARIFDKDFDLLVTPVAWDFEMEIAPLEGFAITQAYGVPSWVAGAERGAVTVHIPTLFLSKNRGAMVMRLEPIGPQAQTWLSSERAFVAETELSYRDDRTSRPHTFVGNVIAPHRHDDVVATEVILESAVDPGLQMAVALVNTGLGLQTAAMLAHAGRHYEALTVLDEVQRLTTSEAFGAERALLSNLRALIEPHAVPPTFVEIPSAHETERRTIVHPEEKGLVGERRTSQGGPGWIR